MKVIELIRICGHVYMEFPPPPPSCFEIRSSSLKFQKSIFLKLSVKNIKVCHTTLILYVSVYFVSIFFLNKWVVLFYVECTLLVRSLYIEGQTVNPGGKLDCWFLGKQKERGREWGDDYIRLV